MEVGILVFYLLNLFFLRGAIYIYVAIGYLDNYGLKVSQKFIGDPNWNGLPIEIIENSPKNMVIYARSEKHHKSSLSRSPQRERDFLFSYPISLLELSREWGNDLVRTYSSSHAVASCR